MRTTPDPKDQESKAKPKKVNKTLTEKKAIVTDPPRRRKTKARGKVNENQIN